MAVVVAVAEEERLIMVLFEALGSGKPANLALAVVSLIPHQ